MSDRDLQDVNNIIDDLYIMRKNSLTLNGEFGLGNLIFKELRNDGVLDQLKDRQKSLMSKNLSLECMK